MNRVYQLKTVAGIAVPTAGIDAETLVLDANGKWATFVTPSSGPTPDPDTGSYSLDTESGALSMLNPNESVYATGYADDDVIVISHDGTLATQGVFVSNAEY